ITQGRARLVVPVAQLPSSDRPYVLEYYLAGITAAQHEAAHAGTPEAPLRTLIENDLASPGARPWYKKMWVWGVIAGAAAATTATILLTRSRGYDVGISP